MKIEVTVRNARLSRMAPALGEAGRRGLHAAMGEEVQTVTAAHVANRAATQHTTADRLGAEPSNFLGRAAEKIAAPTALTADTNAAVLTINHPGFARAFRAVTIVPRQAKALAIPVAAMAYNRRPGQFNLFVFRGKTTGTAFLALRQEDKHAPPLLMYVLLRSVTQRQDRGMLPSDAAWTAAAARGAANYFKMAGSV